MPATTTPKKKRSCDVTREDLRKWGVPVRDCPTGHGTVTAGPDLGAAVHEAWMRDLATVSTHSDEERWWWSGPDAGACPEWLRTVLDA